MVPNEIFEQLLKLSHDLGSSPHEWSILGEGNTSAVADDQTFYVKATGSQLATLRPDQLVRARFETLVSAVGSNETLTDDETKALLADARVAGETATPSVEALFHADLLKSFGFKFIGHTHVASINSLLCSYTGWDIVSAGKRVFPDEVVVCGVSSCAVEYVDPGLPLAREIHKSVEQYIDKHGMLPKTVYLQNHGFIALGQSPAEVVAITRMADKAAKILIGAIACGGPRFMSDADVQRIAGRPDEHIRQRALGLTVAH